MALRHWVYRFQKYKDIQETDNGQGDLFDPFVFWVWAHVVAFSLSLRNDDKMAEVIPSSTFSPSAPYYDPDMSLGS